MTQFCSLAMFVGVLPVNLIHNTHNRCAFVSLGSEFAPLTDVEIKPISIKDSIDYA